MHKRAGENVTRVAHACAHACARCAHAATLAGRTLWGVCRKDARGRGFTKHEHALPARAGMLMTHWYMVYAREQRRSASPKTPPSRRFRTKTSSWCRTCSRPSALFALSPPPVPRRKLNRRPRLSASPKEVEQQEVVRGDPQRRRLQLLEGVGKRKAAGARRKVPVRRVGMGRQKRPRRVVVAAVEVPALGRAAVVEAGRGCD